METFRGQARDVVYSSHQTTCYRSYPLLVAARVKDPRPLITRQWIVLPGDENAFKKWQPLERNGMSEMLDTLYAIRPDYAKTPFRISTPVNEDNESIVTRQGVASCRVHEDSGQRFKCKITHAGRQCDFALTLLPTGLVMTSRVHEQFRDDLRSTFESFPLVFDWKGKQNQDYWYLAPKQRFDIVDYSAAEMIYFDDIVDPRYARRVLTWAVDPAKVPDHRVFSDKFGRTLVESSLKAELADGYSEGILLTPLRSLKEPLLGS